MGPKSYQRSQAARAESEQTHEEAQYRRLVEALGTASKEMKVIKWRSGEQACIPLETWQALLQIAGIRAAKS